MLMNVNDSKITLPLFHGMSIRLKRGSGACIGYRCQGVGNKGLQGWSLWGESMGCPSLDREVPARFKMGLPQDKSEFISQADVTSVKIYLRAESIRGREGNEKGWKIAKREEEELLHGVIGGGLASDQTDIPQETATHGKPVPEQRKSVSSGRKKRLCTDHNTVLSCSLPHWRDWEQPATITRGKE